MSDADASTLDPHLLQLVLMFQGAAYQHMGKIMNPATEKVERDLEQARYAIDILSMLETKTRGNVSDEERKLLERTLYELRMNFIEEVNKGDDSQQSDGETGDSDAAETPSEESGSGAPDESAGGDAETSA